jgi:hypothetical protein
MIWIRNTGSESYCCCQVSRIAVMADHQRDLIRVLNESGPPEQLFLQTRGKVQNEFKNKTWIYDFKGEVFLSSPMKVGNVKTLKRYLSLAFVNRSTN